MAQLVTSAPATRRTEEVATANVLAGGRTAGRRRLLRRDHVLGVIGLIVILGAWELSGRAHLFGRTWVPLETVIDEVRSPGRWELIKRAAAATFGRAATGLVVGFVLGVALASFASMVPPVRRSISGAAVAVNSVPWIALGPLLMIAFSRDRAPAVIAGLAVFFPTFVAATAGLSASSTEQEDLCQALGATRLRRFGVVRLPNALPSLVLGLKLAVPAAIIGAVFGEWFGADRGLGLLLLTSMQQFRPGLLWAVGLLTAGVTMLAYGALGLLEHLIRRRFALGRSAARSAHVSGGSRWRPVAGWTLFVLGIVVVWHVYVAASGVSKFLVPSPARVAGNATDEPWEYVSNAFVTVRLGLAGLVAGLLVGTVLAVATWWSPLLRGLLTPVVIIGRSVPTLALLPVVAGLIGYNELSVLAIGVLISFFPAFVYASKGLRSAPDGSADLMIVLGASRWRAFRTVALPSALTEVAVAIRLSAGICVIAAVAAEFMISDRGLGRMFADAMGRQNIDRAWSVALLIVVLSMVTFAVANRVERAITERLS